MLVVRVEWKKGDAKAVKVWRNHLLPFDHGRNLFSLEKDFQINLGIHRGAIKGKAGKFANVMHVVSCLDFQS